MEMARETEGNVLLLVTLGEGRETAEINGRHLWQPANDSEMNNNVRWMHYVKPHHQQEPIPRHR